jgi:outer membrane usher protein
VEAGLPRLGYGSVDDQYPSTAIASATFRQGLLQWFTAEGHAEAGSDIANGGIGGAFGIGSMGVATAAVAASTGGGLQGAASFETRLLQINLDISSQHTFGNYQDLASATARQQTFTFIPVLSPFGTIEATTPAQARQLLYGTMRPPRALDRITVGGPLRFDTSSSWGLSFVHQQDVLNNVSMLASVSYSRTLPYNASLFVTAFKDFGSLGSAGVLVGLSFPLGGSTSVSANMSSDQGRPVWTTQASRTLGNEPGSVGWQVQDSEGQVPFRQASVAYRAPAMSLRLTADQIGPQLGGTFEGSGAAALMAGDVFLADRIPDAFAVVDAGAPDVAVSYENRPAGTTDSRGMLLVPTLRSYEKNHIAIDPSGLPVDDEFETDRKVVTPADRAGAMVSFAVRKNVAAALVTFVKDDHTFVPAGSHGRLQGGDAFVVGYDGQAFVRNLGPTNTVVIDLAEKPCQATFDFAPQAGKQVQIGPVTCRQ